MRISDWSSDVCSSDLLWLTQYRANAAAVLDHPPCACIDQGAETGEYLQFQKLRVFQPQSFGQRLQHRRLGLAADPRHALADIDRRFLVFVEQAWVEDRKSTRLNSSH